MQEKSILHILRFEEVQQARENAAMRMVMPTLSDMGKSFDTLFSEELARAQGRRDMKDLLLAREKGMADAVAEHEVRKPALPVARDLAPAAEQSTAPSQRPTRKTQADRVKDWLAECERRASAAGETFSRERMPGTKIEFCELLHALDADLRGIKTVGSLDNYLKPAGCKWPLDASAQPSAVPLYARLFPEASIRAPGVTPKQQKKA